LCLDSASDAYAGIQLFYVLDRLRENLQPVPPRPHHHEKGLPIRIAEPSPSEQTSEPAELSAGASPQVEAAESKLAKVTKAQLHEAAASATTKVPSARAQRQANKPAARDSRISAAETSMQAYYKAPKKKAISVGPSSLRAYYIWHANTDLQPEAVAKLLRDPPLKTNTVVTYILDAIVAEKLPYDKSRLNQEVLCLLQPKALGLPKYRSLAQDHQAL
jgi:exonuclease 3'-5' domain-containing protein 2